VLLGLTDIAQKFVNAAFAQADGAPVDHVRDLLAELRQATMTMFGTMAGGVGSDVRPTEQV
jgi:hypothetical protein